MYVLTIASGRNHRHASSVSVRSRISLCLACGRYVVVVVVVVATAGVRRSLIVNVLTALVLVSTVVVIEEVVKYLHPIFVGVLFRMHVW